MISIEKLTNLYEDNVARLAHLEGVALLALRLILAPVMIVAGYNKLGLSNDEIAFPMSLLAEPSIVQWFGNSEWGLGLPFPELLGFIAAWTEFLGGWCLLLGLMTRLWAIPLMFTMAVAAMSVHLDNGWYAIAPTDAKTSPTLFFQWLGFDSAQQSAEQAQENQERLGVIREQIDEHQYSRWLKGGGSVVILNNGIEFSASYFVMLFILLLYGGGRYTSVDYYLKRTLFR